MVLDTDVGHKVGDFTLGVADLFLDIVLGKRAIDLLELRFKILRSSRMSPLAILLHR